jgi:transposase-like protein
VNVSEHDYENDPKHQEALERVTMRLLNDRVARRKSAAHAANTRARMGHAPEDSTARTLADALADSYLRTEALARAFTENSEEPAGEEPAGEEPVSEPAAFHGDLKDAALKLRAQGLSYGQIARKLRVNPSNARRWCLAHTAPDTPDTPQQAQEQDTPVTGHNNSQHPPEVRARALKLRAQGLTLSRVSKETGVPKGTLHGWFQLAGLTGYLPRVEPEEPAPPAPVWTLPLQAALAPEEPLDPAPAHTLARLAEIASLLKALEDERAKLLAPLLQRRAALLQELAALSAAIEGTQD